MQLFRYWVAILLFVLSLQSIVNADERSSPIQVNDNRLDIDESSKVIKAVLAMEDFKTTEKHTSWKLDLEFDEESKSDNNQLWKIFITSMAKGVEYLFWLLPILLLTLLIYYRDKWIKYLQPSSDGNDTDMPDTVLGIKLGSYEIPDDVIEHVRNLWQQEKHRDALSLLFRASIEKLLENYKINISRGATEKECVNAVKAMVDNDLGSYFEQLAGCWTRLAYGHIRPEDEFFDSLCLEWRQYFNSDSLR